MTLSRKSLGCLYFCAAIFLCILYMNQFLKSAANNTKKQAKTSNTTQFMLNHKSLNEIGLFKVTKAGKMDSNFTEKSSRDPNNTAHAVKKEYENIKNVLADYPFKYGTKLSDYVYEMGGNPIKALVSVQYYKTRFKCQEMMYVGKCSSF